MMTPCRSPCRRPVHMLLAVEPVVKRHLEEPSGVTGTSTFLGRKPAAWEGRKSRARPHELSRVVCGREGEQGPWCPRGAPDQPVSNLVTIRADSSPRERSAPVGGSLWAHILHLTSKP